jgi:hypothetical protein
MGGWKRRFEVAVKVDAFMFKVCATDGAHIANPI